MIHLSKRSAWPVLAVLALTGLAWAQEPASVPDEQVMERLSVIQNALDAGRPRARTWWYGWLGAYGAATAVQWGLSIGHWDDVKPADESPGAPMVADRSFAQDMLVGGGTTALGAVGLLIDPFLPALSHDRLRGMPEATPEDRRAKLEEAEALLRRCALREKAGQGWTMHALNLGVNAAAGVVTSVAFKRPWTDGLVTFAVGEAVSLLNIFTQPRRAVRDWHNYEVRYLAKPGDSLPETPESRLSFGFFPGGFSLSWAW